MERKAFELLSAMENSWWYRGRAKIVESVLHYYELGMPEGNVLDYGAGSGGMIETLKKFGTVFGSEPDEIARNEAVSRGYKEVYASDADALQRKYQLAVFCDVLEHIEDDRETLERVRESLTLRGVVVMTVPAYQWMWSVHDVNHHHFRRYNRWQVIKLLEDAGFRVRYASYWNTSLFPLAGLTRLIGKTGEGSLGLPKFINDILLAVINLEAYLMQFIPLPWGTGIVAVGEKRN